MILVGTDDGIYRWYEGAPWLTFHSLQGRPIVSLASVGGGVIAAVDASGRLLETEDNGLSWRDVPLPPGAGRASALAVAGTPAAIALATRPLGLFLRPIGARAPRQREGRLAALVQRGRGLVGGGGTAVAPAPRSVSLGWMTLGMPQLPDTPMAPVIRELRKSEGEDGTWYACVVGAGLWRSPDGGQSWSRCEGLPAEVHALRPIPRQPGGLVAATSEGCRISANGGQTWTDASAGLENHRHLRVVEVRPDDPRHLLAGAASNAPGEGVAAPREGLGFALFESRDGGKSWASVARNFPVRLPYDTIDDIRWDPAAPGFAIIALASGECWRTRSEGAWWEPIARQTRAARVLCVAD